MEEAFFPVVVMVNTIPVVAKAPILVLLLGNGMEPKIAIAALICFFPTLVNMVRGLESVNPQAMELMRVLSASKREVFFKLRLLQLAALSVLGAEDRRLDRGDRRHRRRMDRLDQGIGALIIQATYNFDSRAALRHRDRRLGLLGRCSSWRSSLRRAPRRALAARRALIREAILPKRAHDRMRRRPMTASRTSPARPAWSRASDVVVVGGGPAGFAAAIAARAQRRSVTLLERYPYLGGLASGGMVLVLDDMHNGEEITVTASASR